MHSIWIFGPEKFDKMPYFRYSRRNFYFGRYYQSLEHHPFQPSISESATLVLVSAFSVKLSPLHCEFIISINHLPSPKGRQLILPLTLPVCSHYSRIFPAFLHSLFSMRMACSCLLIVDLLWSSSIVQPGRERCSMGKSLEEQEQWGGSSTCSTLLILRNCPFRNAHNYRANRSAVVAFLRQFE